MTPDDAMREMAAGMAEAAAGVLRIYLPDGIDVGEAEVVPEGVSPLDGVAIPAVAAEVVHDGGARGATLLVTTLTGARALAAAVIGSSPVPGGHPLDLAERDALTRVTHEILAGASPTLFDFVGPDLRSGAAEIRDLESVVDAVALTDSAEHAAQATLTIAGEPCRLAQLVPAAVATTMAVPAADRHAADGAAEIAGRAVDQAAIADDILRGVQLRVCAEIGRAAMPMAEAVSLPPGGLVELDRGPEEPVDILVNGRRFATGRLVLVEGEWAVRVEDVLLDTAQLAPQTASAIERG